MAENQDSEQPVQEVDRKMTLTERVTDGLRAIPPILGCTAGAYLLNLSGCVNRIAESLPADGLNLGYHLAAGSGLYGGYTSKAERKIASLVTLAGSFTPEIAMLAQDGDLRSVGTASAAKLVGYGLGYIVGHIFGE
ncbi:hypothetical protein COV20_06025 [Candidatus Woesearchaeota archaeon CG10_big_fil_rev_8_21_14_0_10_45_16]|nr:MAG: hypothetical protein COV20_06025 [Candidatus Woesearchaeota archaeon CG10_big_fil_rev_8_21_14_0_10_45_16]